MRNAFAVVLSLTLLLSGCALDHAASPLAAVGLPIQGAVHGGRQPIVGAHVYLMAANTTGYGQPSLPLLNPANTGNSDSVGAYVISAADGTFSITGDYLCTSGQQVYVYALGGDPGAGTNSAAGLMAALGTCPNTGSFASTVPFIQVNEVTTVAAAYALAGFTTDALHVSSSGTPLAQVGIANAFATAGNLANLATGLAYSTTPAGNGTVPQDIINTIADILASCVNSIGPSSSNCGTLFSNAQNGSEVSPVETATAAVNIAHHPVSNVGTLFGLIPPAPPFLPNRGPTPNDFTLSLYFGDGGIQFTPNTALAIDSQGNVWSTSVSGSPSSVGHVIKLSPLGVSLASSTGYAGGGLSIPVGIAVDPQDNIWTVNYSASSPSLIKLDNSGNFLSGASGFTGGGLHFPRSLASDGSGNIFVGNYGGNGNEIASSLSKFTNSGSPLSSGSGFTAGGLLGPGEIAVDPSANVWVTSYFENGNPTGDITKMDNTGTELSGAAGFTASGIDIPRAIAIDGAGSAWIANLSGEIVRLSSAGGSPATFTGGGFYATSAIAIDGLGDAWVINNHDIGELDSSGNALSGLFGFTSSGDGNKAIAIDGSGNVWSVSNEFVNELVGAAAPVVTPIALGVANNTLATRP